MGPDGSLYIADTRNHRVRKVGPDGIITTVAGNGSSRALRRRRAGHGGPGSTTPEASRWLRTAASTSPTPATTACAG